MQVVLSRSAPFCRQIFTLRMCNAICIWRPAREASCEMQHSTNVRATGWDNFSMLCKIGLSSLPDYTAGRIWFFRPLFVVRSLPSLSLCLSHIQLLVDFIFDVGPLAMKLIVCAYSCRGRRLLTMNQIKLRHVDCHFGNFRFLVDYTLFFFFCFWFSLLSSFHCWPRFSMFFISSLFMESQH